MQTIKCGFCKHKYKTLDTPFCRKCLSKYRATSLYSNVDNFEFECPMCSTNELPAENTCECGQAVSCGILEKRKTL